jgi:hypothetical protein
MRRAIFGFEHRLTGPKVDKRPRPRREAGFGVAREIGVHHVPVHPGRDEQVDEAVVVQVGQPRIPRPVGLVEVELASRFQQTRGARIQEQGVAHLLPRAQLLGNISVVQ